MYLCWGIARTRPSIEQVGQPRGWCLHRRDPDQGRPQLRKKNKWTIPATIELNYDIPEGSDAVKEVRNCLEELPPCAGSSATTMAARVRWCDACDEQSGYSDVKNGAGTQGEHLTDQQMSGRS